ncbi:hypothetical protein LKM00_26490 [Bacillus wiedmannii]|uniref:hypothetical protein n=1 Tax=Bacillus wiedmannii TaxID=1890302 RepID=UPI001E63466D|nr:hypothetical protein [Bacillus wiedmannii]MCC2380949.1 hypothetical protein [Bacillus wiedmannii]MCC2425363.1 hypothetical protein [Bacillus wiedmannii]
MKYLLTHKHEIGFLYIREKKQHQVIFRKKNEPDQILNFTEKEDPGTFVTIRSFHYLCLNTKETLEFSKEDILHITESEKEQRRRLESFIESRSPAMMKVIRMLKDNSFVNESHLILENIKTDDWFRSKHHFLFRSTLLIGFFICITYDANKKEFDDCFVHTEDPFYELFNLYRSHDDDDKRIRRDLIPIMKRDKTIRLKLLLL